jgi:hypothetical protein
MTIRALSDILIDLEPHLTEKETSLHALLEAFHERGFGFFLFLFALPAALPLPGLGINTIIALPLLILTFQIAIGRHTVWMPEGLRHKGVSSAKVRKFADLALPWLKRAEFFVRPRLGFVTQGVFSILVGITLFIMALSVAVPLPLTNTIPSFGIAVTAIGLMMRDGLAVMAGVLIGMVWVILFYGLLFFLGMEGIALIKETITSFLA